MDPESVQIVELDKSLTLRDSNGFELEPESGIPFLKSTRNKMDPFYGQGTQGRTSRYCPEVAMIFS